MCLRGGAAHVGGRAGERSVSGVFGAARRRGGWAPARLVLLARRLLPAACSPHGGASPPYSRGDYASSSSFAPELLPTTGSVPVNDEDI